MTSPFSRRALAIEPSLTVSITARAAEMIRAGEDVISMSAGEPDFHTPANIGAAGIQAIQEGRTRYTAPASGLLELKQAVARKFQRDNALHYAPNQVVVTCGAKQVIFDAIVCLVDEGDEVILPAPLYVSYADQVKLMGGVPVILQTDPDDGFCLTPDQLEAALTDRSKLVIFNSPCNPTGGVYPRERLQALADVIARTDLWVISDEIYESFIYDGIDHVSIAALNPAVKERTLVVNGVSKSYAMTGWRVGYGAGPLELMTLIATIQSQETTNTCTISQYAAVEALEGPQDSIAAMRNVFRRRRDRFAGRLDALPGVRCPRPPGAFYVFPDVRELCANLGDRAPDDVALCRLLLEHAGVAAVPGTGFGTPGYIRFSYTLPEERLDAAADRITAAIDDLLNQ